MGAPEAPAAGDSLDPRCPVGRACAGPTGGWSRGPGTSLAVPDCCRLGGLSPLMWDPCVRPGHKSSVNSTRQPPRPRPRSFSVTGGGHRTSGPPSRRCPGLGVPRLSACWPLSPLSPLLRASMPTRSSHPGGGGGDHTGHILNTCPTVGGRGRETRAHPAHCSHPGQGNVSPGPASRLLARGHGNQLGHHLAGPKRAGLDLPTAVGGGRARPAICHFVCPQAVGPERGRWPAPGAATCQATVPGAVA